MPGTGVTPGSAIRTSPLAVPVRSAHLLGYPWPQAPDSCSWLLRSLKGSLPPFFSDPYLSYCSVVLWLPVLPDRGSHNLKPSRVKTIQYCVRLGSGARWTAFVMVPGLQTYHLHGLLASMVTVLCGFVRRLVECVWLMACSDCAHCSSNAVIGLLTTYSSTRDQPAPNRRVIRASCSSKVIQWPS